jgi:3-oxoacyl-(acyl-carrier-protein) synthase
MRERPVRAALTNSLGFGGHNATLALKRFEE